MLRFFKSPNHAILQHMHNAQAHHHHPGVAAMAGEIEHQPRVLIVDDDLSQGRVEQVGGRRLRDLYVDGGQQCAS